MGDSKTVVAAALGECVHVAGVMNFLRLAEAAGWKTVFLGPAVPVERVLAAAQEHNASLVGVSYRLTPETGERLLGEFAEAADDLRAAGVCFAFGGTPPVAERAGALGFFEQIFDGSEHTESVLAYLKGQTLDRAGKSSYPQTTIGRIEWKAPFPLLRHHFGKQFDAVFAGVCVLPALIAILNTLAIGVIERTREIGMLRAIGAARGQVRRMIVAEALLLAAIGTAFGILGGLYLNYLMVAGLSASGVFRMEYSFPLASILAATAAGLIFGVLAALFPARQAARMEIIRALRYE